MLPRTEYRFLVIVLCFGFLVDYAKTQSSSCETPDKIAGTCIDLMQCQPMIKVISALKRPYSTKVAQQLNAYKCGTNGVIKVCCPPGPIVLDSGTRDPPDVSQHKNINLLPQTCGYLDTGSKIVDGENAALNEFPWMALFQYQTGKGLRFLCGGTIIHKNYILTAAHCLTELRPNTKLVSIRVGEHSIKNETDCQLVDKRAMKIKCNPPVQDLTIEEIIPHPQFGGMNGDNINDIGLVRVSTINLEVENARPVCLPIGIVRDAPFNRVIVTGWGVSDIRTGATSDILQKVGLKVANKETCVKNYADANKTLTYSQLCAGGDSTKDSCAGDSGGPAVIPALLGDSNFIYVQQGIVSYGPKYCGISGFPGVYTLVKYYMDWILDNIKP